jgi:hypothetical protein
MLLQVATAGCDWDTFRSQAENVSWMAFPDNIVNSINLDNEEYDLKSQDKDDLNVSAGKVFKKVGMYCRIHGECGHTTNNCEII